MGCATEALRSKCPRHHEHLNVNTHKHKDTAECQANLMIGSQSLRTLRHWPMQQLTKVAAHLLWCAS